MVEMTPIQKLQHVLDVLAKTEIVERSLVDINNMVSSQIDLIELSLILDRLEKDSFVKTRNFTIQFGTTKYYTITFDGKVFSEQGGYIKDLELKEAEIAKLQSEKLFQDKQAKALRSSQIWIMIGTLVAALYYLGELIKFLAKLVFPCFYHEYFQ